MYVERRELSLPALARYDGVMAEESKSSGVKSTIGVVGAIATIVSVWWFALRPRKKRGGE